MKFCLLMFIGCSGSGMYSILELGSRDLDMLVGLMAFKYCSCTGESCFDNLRVETLCSGLPSRSWFPMPPALPVPLARKGLFTEIFLMEELS
jgi:hypothetical protein